MLLINRSYGLLLRRFLIAKVRSARWYVNGLVPLAV